jgi:hypothetical protein
MVYARTILPLYLIRHLPGLNPPARLLGAGTKINFFPACDRLT